MLEVTLLPMRIPLPPYNEARCRSAPGHSAASAEVGSASPSVRKALRRHSSDGAGMGMGMGNPRILTIYFIRQSG